ncbi:MAG: isoleucine--tRNA ligase [Terrimicrobiaceae bacterium]
MSTYKDTLNLPRTDFPMKAGLAEREPLLLKKWEDEDLYGQIQAARADCPLYVMHDGPPFANGDVHMGTALNKILKDFVVKSRTMAGYRAPYVPGWDCHGLPIEFKVVQEQRGLAPAEVRRRSEEYARKFIDIQRGQFRRLGVLGDWGNPYLTLDPGYEAAIVRAFGRFVAAGLVYQSKKPVLWSTGAQTALAEAEVEYQDKTSIAVTVKFALEGERAGASIVIWTTTPWTLPANLAIAVHPRHQYVLAELPGHGRVVVAGALLGRLAESAGNVTPVVLETFPGESLAGLKARHPFLERTATVYTADFVTLDTGTGCVHIAPGHGEDDYLLGRQHGLELLSPVDDRGCFVEECGVPSLVGRQVFEANPAIVEILQAAGALIAREDYQHSYPHCWRSKTPVIFRAIEQFFIRIDDLRGRALEAIAATQWLPHWGRNRIQGTVESRPDWCISRQRTWGVPLPVFYDAGGAPVLDPVAVEKVAAVFESEGTNAWFEHDDAWWAARVGLPEGTTRRNDTLDVWIDSGVSHEAVLRAREELGFPADLYLEATDQHRGWFQSSLMTSVALNGVAPYKAVLTHGFVVDVDTRKKISKSAQGGYAKPTEVEHYVKKYGADLVRLWVSSVNFTDDVPFSEEIFTRLGDAYRRIRNTLRILLANGGARTGALEGAEKYPLVDRWILSRLQDIVATCREAYEALEFHRVFRVLNDFCAVELSSLYVDITKDRLYCDKADSPRRQATTATMRHVFDVICRLLAPVLAFTAEEAWGHFAPGRSVHLELFPEADPALRDADVESLMAAVWETRGLVTQGLERAQKAGTISGTLEARVLLTLPPGPLADFALSLPAELEELFILSHLEVVAGGAAGVEVTRSERVKCARCWRHREDVGCHPDHPEICGRCAEAVVVSA